MKVVKLQEGHWPAVAQIYKDGIATGLATFETTVPSWENWDKAHTQHSRLVVVEKDRVLGWAALSAVSSRCVYEGVAEVSVYVSTEARNKGVGKLALFSLISESEKNGIWTLQAGIFPQNKASIQLHQKLGFRLIGERERIGKLGDTWYNNCIFERRSIKIGL
jgi:phosphinothricin acetyltransferase